MKRNSIAAYVICPAVLLFIAVCLISGTALCQDTTLKIPETVPVEAGSFYMGMDVNYEIFVINPDDI